MACRVMLGRTEQLEDRLQDTIEDLEGVDVADVLDSPDDNARANVEGDVIDDEFRVLPTYMS